MTTELPPDTAPEQISKHPRSKKTWDRREAKRAMVLLANGYEKAEVSEHVGRGVSSINKMLADYGTSMEELRLGRALTKMETLDLPPLPPYDPSLTWRPVEVDFPNLSLTPPVAVLKPNVGNNVVVLASEEQLAEQRNAHPAQAAELEAAENEGMLPGRVVGGAE